jgi:hypothetical protein
MRGRAARRLEQVARPLEPDRPPYYVRLPVPPGLERTFPAEGWYWRPAGHPVAVFLGANELTAAIALHGMIQEQLTDAR